MSGEQRGEVVVVGHGRQTREHVLELGVGIEAAALGGDDERVEHSENEQIDLTHMRASKIDSPCVVRLASAPALWTYSAREESIPVR